MSRRYAARRLSFGAARALLVSAIAGAALGAVPACYSAGTGTNPPTQKLYFPVGLQVSGGGNVLYAVNSDFDLQWNGGTLQSYNLYRLRGDAVSLINANVYGDSLASEIPFLVPRPADCLTSPPVSQPNGARLPLGQACAPPVDSTQYVRDSATIGAFATDLQLSPSGTRLFAPVRGDASVTWANVPGDNPAAPPPDSVFSLDCGTRVDGRCDAAHHAGNDPNAFGNTRHVTMPGEPFGMAQTEDGSALAVTHQTDTKTSLLATGFGGTSDIAGGEPSMQFVLDGLPTGGNGIAAVPHDPDAVMTPPCSANASANPNQRACVRPAFLQTSRNAAELDLLRYYDDDGSSLHRPFLAKEVVYGLTANSGGTDCRGIAIDATPRQACKARAAAASGGTVRPDDSRACGQLPARVFIASRTPPSLVVGRIGGPSASGDGSYDPDRLVITGNVPLSDGPSKVYLAPIVDATGHYALRLFVVCFDSNTIFVYDPDAQAVENVINVGPGPFAMAFDPFSWADVAAGQLGPVVADDPRYASLPPGHRLKRYRFAYVASFTQSFVQVLDLDASSPATFERVVFTLGQPTPPKGT